MATTYKWRSGVSLTCRATRIDDSSIDVSTAPLIDTLTPTGVNDVALYFRKDSNGGASADLNAETDGLGDTINLASVNVIVLKNNGTNVVTVTGDFWPASATPPPLQAGAVYYVEWPATPETVTNTSKDTITVTSSGGENFVDFYLSGVKA